MPCWGCERRSASASCAPVRKSRCSDPTRSVTPAQAVHSGFGDFDSGVGFGYVMNQMGSGLLIDPRAARLIACRKGVSLTLRQQRRAGLESAALN